MPAELSSKDIEEKFHALAELEKDFEKTDLEIRMFSSSRF